MAAFFVLSNNHGNAVIWFSNHRSTSLDTFFTIITKVGEAWSYVLLLLILLCYKFRYALMVFALAILVPLISQSLKRAFSQPRPKRFFMDNGLFDNLNLIEGVALYTGNNSFPSGHTVSAFAVLGFAAYAFRKFSWVSISLLFLAICVALSRVYMMQHFLLDVCVGASIGSAIALLVSWLSVRITRTNASWLEKNVLKLENPKIKA